MLVLQTLTQGRPRHGFEIAESIEERSEGVLVVEEGSLYPALQRLLVKGWIAGDWGKTEGNRRARYYRLTSSGRKQLERELSQYQRISQAIGKVLQPV